MGADCKFIMRTAYFAPWNSPPCLVSLVINSSKKLDQAEVCGEDKGRTTHNSEMTNVTDKPGTVDLLFDDGEGMLFLWYFEILVLEVH